MRTWKRLHDDESGVVTMETVMVIAVAAIVMATIKLAWPGIKRWFRKSIQEVIGWNE